MGCVMVGCRLLRWMQNLLVITEIHDSFSSHFCFDFLSLKSNLAAVYLCDVFDWYDIVPKTPETGIHLYCPQDSHSSWVTLYEWVYVAHPGLKLI